MTNEERETSEGSNLEPIPEEQQNMSIAEIVERGYEVARSDGDEQSSDTSPRPAPGFAPGRVPNDDSIAASSEEVGGTDQGHHYSAGYDSDAATRIGLREDDPDTERLRQLNEGRHRSDGEHSIREHHRDKKRIAQAICSGLPLARHERVKVVRVVELLEFERFGSQGSIPKVVLGVISVVVDEQLRNPQSESSEIVSRSDEFRDTCDSLDVSMSDLSTVKRKVREALQEGDVMIPQGGESLTTTTEGPAGRDPTLPAPTPFWEQPGFDWEECPARQIVWLARSWPTVPGNQKSSIPDELRQRIDQLRRWEPWRMNNRYENQKEDDRPNTVEAPNMAEQSICADIEAEAAALIDEMESSDSD